jgi:hypothetical protein
MMFVPRLLLWPVWDQNTYSGYPLAHALNFDSGAGPVRALIWNNIVI